MGRRFSLKQISLKDMASLLLQSFFSIFSLFLRILLASIGSCPMVSPYVILGEGGDSQHTILPERVFATRVASSVAVDVSSSVAVD